MNTMMFTVVGKMSVMQNQDSYLHLLKSAKQQVTRKYILYALIASAYQTYLIASADTVGSV